MTASDSRRRDILWRLVRLVGPLVCLAYISSVAVAEMGRSLNWETMYDDAFRVVGASLMQAGDVPHRDFWYVYPVLDIYLGSVIFRIFGKSMIASRFLPAGLYLSVCLATMFFLWRSEKFSGNKSMWLFLFVSLLLVGKIMNSPWFIGFALGFSGLLLGFPGLENRSPGLKKISWIFLSGALIAFCTSSRLHFGLFFTIAVLAPLLLMLIRPRSENEISSPLDLLLYMASWGAGFALGIAPLIYYYLKNGLLRLFWEQCILFQMTTQTGVRVRLFPFYWTEFSPDNIISAFLTYPFSIFVVLFPMLIIAFWNLINGRKIKVDIIALCVLGAQSILMGHFAMKYMIFMWPVILIAYLAITAIRQPIPYSLFSTLLAYAGFVNYFLSNADMHHVRPCIVIGAAILFMLSFNIRRRRLYWLIWLITAAFLFLLPYYTNHNSFSLFQGGLRYRIPRVFRGVLVLAHPEYWFGIDDPDHLEGHYREFPWNHIYHDREIVEACLWVRGHTEADEAIYVGEVDHTTFNWAMLLAYWLIDRPPATPYTLERPLASCKATAEELAMQVNVQEEIISDLKNRRVAWLFLWDRPYYPGSLEEICAPRILDDYIYSHYKKEKEFGEYLIYRRIKEY